MNGRVRIKVERFSIETDEKGYERETKRETLLETCADPTDGNLQMMEKQVILCLSGYRSEPVFIPAREVQP